VIAEFEAHVRQSLVAAMGIPSELLGGERRLPLTIDSYLAIRDKLSVLLVLYVTDSVTDDSFYRFSDTLAACNFKLWNKLEQELADNLEYRAEVVGRSETTLVVHVHPKV